MYTAYYQVTLVTFISRFFFPSLHTPLLCGAPHIGKAHSFTAFGLPGWGRSAVLSSNDEGLETPTAHEENTAANGAYEQSLTCLAHMKQITTAATALSLLRCTNDMNHVIFVGQKTLWKILQDDVHNSYFR